MLWELRRNRYDNTLMRKMDIATWEPVIVDGKLTARVCCPGCQTKATLDDHHIADSGQVMPSLDCPNCSFHESGIVLVDWEPDWTPTKHRVSAEDW